MEKTPDATFNPKVPSNDTSLPISEQATPSPLRTPRTPRRIDFKNRLAFVRDSFYGGGSNISRKLSSEAQRLSSETRMGPLQNRSEPTISALSQHTLPGTPKRGAVETIVLCNSGDPDGAVDPNPYLVASADVPLTTVEEMLEKIPVSPRPQDEAQFTQICRLILRGSSLSERQLKPLCAELLKHSRKGLREFSAQIEVEGVTQSHFYTLSELVDKILLRYPGIVRSDPVFAAVLGELRFESVLGPQIDDIHRIQNMIKETVASRRALIQFMGGRYAVRCQRAIDKLGLEALSCDEVPAPIVKRFYDIMKLSRHLEGVDLNIQRAEIPLIIQSPHRILLEVNNGIHELADALHTDHLTLSRRLQDLQAARDRPENCLDTKYWIELLKHASPIGKSKERLAKVFKQLISRSVNAMALERGIPRDVKARLLSELATALPDQRQADWDTLAALTVRTAEHQQLWQQKLKRDKG